MPRKHPFVIDRRSILKAGAAGVAVTAAGSTLARAVAQSTPSASPAASASPMASPVASKPVEYSGGAAELTYGYWDQSQKEGVDAQIAAFTEKFPDITIEAQQVPWDDYWTQLQTSVSGGETFDVFWMNSANCQVYARSNSLLDIEDLIADGYIVPSNYPEQLIDLYNVEGTQYAITRDVDTIGLYFNKDLFDAAGVDYPTADWTWDDFRSNAEKMTDEGKGVWGVGLQPSTQETWYNFVFQNDGALINDDGTKCLVGEPAGTEALAFLAQMFVDGLTPSMAVQQANAIADTLFPAGQIAMMPGGSWRAAVYASADANIDVAPLPKKVKRATVVHGLGNVIWSGTKSPEAAKAFVAWMASKEGEDVLAEKGTGMPAMNGMQQPWVDKVPEMNLQVLVDALDYGIRTGDAPVGAEWQNAMAEVVNKGFSGDIEPDQIGPEAAKAADAALAKA